MDLSAPRLAAIALLLMVSAGIMHQQKITINELPVFVHQLWNDTKICEGTTAMQRLGCGQGVHFSDMRKLDIRSSNRLLGR